MMKGRLSSHPFIIESHAWFVLQVCLERASVRLFTLHVRLVSVLDLSIYMAVSMLMEWDLCGFPLDHHAWLLVISAMLVRTIHLLMYRVLYISYSTLMR